MENMINVGQITPNHSENATQRVGAEIIEPPVTEKKSRVNRGRNKEAGGQPRVARNPNPRSIGARTKIVCGTDFSIHAREATDVAAAMSQRTGAPLVVAHAVEPARSGGGSKRLTAMLRYRGRNNLAKDVERLRAVGVNVAEEFLTGVPSIEVVKCAQRHEAGLIVVSSLGEVHPGRWLIGSVAEQIAQTSPAPVLVVRNPRPFIDGFKKRKPLNILIGHDFSPSADAAVAWVAALKAIARCRINIVHFSLTQVAPDWLQVGTSPGGKMTLVQTRELLADALRERCKAQLGTARFQIHVRSIRGSVDSRLVAFAKEQGADLIVVGTNQKSTIRRLCLGSVSRGVLRETSSSVACVPIAAPAH